MEKQRLVVVPADELETLVIDAVVASFKYHYPKPEAVPISSKADFVHVDEICGNWYKCPSCKDTYIMREDNYCGNCGGKFEWSDT